MTRFQMFDYVEITGNVENGDVPVGTRGSIVDDFGDGAYIVDVASMELDICDVVVRAESLQLIRHSELAERLSDLPLRRSDDGARTGDSRRH